MMWLDLLIQGAIWALGWWLASVVVGLIVWAVLLPRAKASLQRARKALVEDLDRLSEGW